MSKEHIEVLTIAGHDSDGSAGMPADLHAFMHVAFMEWGF